MQRCTICGSESPTTARFCGYCGNVLNASSDITSFSATALSLPDSREKDEPVFTLPTSGDGHEQDTFINWLPLKDGEDQPTLPAERRTDLLIDGPGIGLFPANGQVPGVNVPMVYGTPRPGDIPVVHGTPPHFAGPHTPPPSQSIPHHLLAEVSRSTTPPPAHTVHHPQSEVQELETQPKPEHHPFQHHSQARGTKPEPHHHFQSQAAKDRGVQVSHEAFQHTKAKSEPLPQRQKSRVSRREQKLSKPQLGGAAAKWVLIAIVVVVVVATAAIGLIFAFSPSLSLRGGSSVTSGGTLQVHGSGFLPAGSVILTLDNGQPLSLYGVVGGGAAGDGIAANAMALLQPLQSTASAATVPVSRDGTFNATIQVSKNWSLGEHALHATQGPKSAVLPFKITSPAIVVSPTATLLPTPDATAVPTPTSTASPTPKPTSTPTPNPTISPSPTSSPTAVPQPVLSVSPTSINANTDCQLTSLNHTSWACVVTLYNKSQKSSSSLNWTASANIPSATGVIFTPKNGILKPGQSIQVSVDPFYMSCPNTGTLTFTGSANTVDIPWTCSQILPDLSLSPGQLNANTDCSQGSDGWTCTATLSNPSTNQATGNWSASSSGVSGITISPTNGALPPGQSVQLTIFVPTVTCPASASIDIAGSSAPLGLQWTCSEPPTLSVSPTQIGDGSNVCTLVGNGYTCVVTVTEDANSQGNLNWTANSSISGITFSPSSGTLSPGQSVQVTISVPGCGTNNITFQGSNNTVTVTYFCS